MTHRMLGGAKRINVILSEAKNLLHIRGIAGMPRPFAEFILSEVEGLRMTTVGRSVRKSTVSLRERVRVRGYDSGTRYLRSEA